MPAFLPPPRLCHDVAAQNDQCCGRSVASEAGETPALSRNGDASQVRMSPVALVRIRPIQPSKEGRVGGTGSLAWPSFGSHEGWPMDLGPMPRSDHRVAPFRIAVPVVAVAMTLASLAGCSDGSASRSASTRAGGCISDFQEGSDYFPDKVTPSDATGFTVEYHNSYKVVTVAQTSQGGPSAKYVLVQCGAPQPNLSGDLAAAQRITIPVARVASSSTTQLPAFDLLGSLDAIAAVSTPDLVNTAAAVERIKAGKVTGFGSNSGEISVEKVIAAHPDVYLAGGMDDSVLGKIKEAKIPVVADSAWLEATPLGRAEWIKFFALFVDQEQRATKAFGTIAANYHTARARAQAAAGKPTVLTGKQYKGTWSVAGGQSYVAAFLKDAGASYIFADTPGTGSKSLDMETVLAKGASAQFWLNAEMTRGWTSAADVTKDDPRYGNLAALRQGNVFSPVKRVGAGGGNDYWESGVVHPDVVLADLIAILHPELMPNHTFEYYAKLGS
jgi:iron complex transport system substrate-binding protein